MAPRAARGMRGEKNMCVQRGECGVICKEPVDSRDHRLPVSIAPRDLATSFTRASMRRIPFIAVIVLLTSATSCIHSVAGSTAVGRVGSGDETSPTITARDLETRLVAF